MDEKEKNYYEQIYLNLDERIEEEKFKSYIEGRKDERNKIMEVIDEADDAYNAMFLLMRYFVSEEL